MLIPAPQDMPFLLRLALGNLASLDLTSCREILVVPDGRRSDPAELEKAAADASDPRIRVVPLRPLQRALADRIPRADGGANFRHWITILRGLDEVSTTHAFLHDIDAFWSASDAVESRYQECVRQGWWSLGVARRWDPFFTQQGVALPATWELTFDVQWARSRRPTDHKGGVRSTPDGDYCFDTMLWSQFSDYSSGKIAVDEAAVESEYVHFNGAITTYRTYCRQGARQTTDELFRLLLLSLWESAAGVVARRRLLPSPAQLAKGLTNPAAPISYDSPVCLRGYAEFRHMVLRLAECAPFAVEICEQMELDLAPFDQRFAFDPARPFEAAVAVGEVRTTGLNLSGARP
jgi:hypothetical protein